MNTKNPYLDEYCYYITGKNPNMHIPWFLMACKAYDKDDDPIISDACFDEISVQMYAQFSDLTHFHKHLINAIENETNRKGSSIDVKWDQWPERIDRALIHLRQVWPSVPTTST